jgi:hypothetical protein
MTIPEDFFQSLFEVFETVERNDPQTFYYRIAGKVLRLRFAGPALIPRLTPAIRHLQTHPAAYPDYTICCWDSRSTGSFLPSPPWGEDDYREFGLVRGYNNQRIRTAYQVSLNMMNVRRKLGLYWIADARKVPYYHSITPLRTLLHWFLISRRCLIVHAAGVGKPEGGVMITGKGGAGKSTCAFACLGSRVKYAGDENCVVNLDGQPLLSSLYSSGSLEVGDEKHFPHLDPALDPRGLDHAQKQVYFLHPQFKVDLITEYPLKAILIPGQTAGQKTTISPYPRSGSLFALAPGTIFQLPGEGEKAFRAAADLVRSLPCYQLNLGLDFQQIPRVIEDFLEQNQ